MMGETAMESIHEHLYYLIHHQVYDAVILFIFIHIIRPFLFIPAIVLCIAGGVIFEPINDSMIPVIGLVLSSLIFYLAMSTYPNAMKKLIQMKQKLFGKYTHLSVGYITMLRLIPFMHFQLLAFCILEQSGNFKEYIKNTILSTVPFVCIYTIVGKSINEHFSLYSMILLMIVILMMLSNRKKLQRLRWNEFFI